MSGKILVTYASRGGSTAGVAEAIANTLTEQGILVELYPMEDVHDLSAYSAVIAGSAIQIDKWLPEASDFISRYQKELVQIPVATFTVCMALALRNDEKTRTKISSQVQVVREMVMPVSEDFFAGALNLSKIPSLPFQVLVRFGILIGFWKEGDYRDWDAIRQWANSLPKTLISQAEVQEYV